MRERVSPSHLGFNLKRLSVADSSRPTGEGRFAGEGGLEWITDSLIEYHQVSDLQLRQFRCGELYLTESYD